MKLIHLIVGGAFSYFGYHELTLEPANNFGWILVAIGVIVILKSLGLTGRDSNSSGASISWSSSDGGGDCGGGGGGD